MRFPDISTEAGKIRREKLRMDPYVMKRGTREILYIDFRYAGGVYVKFSNSAYPLSVIGGALVPFGARDLSVVRNSEVVCYSVAVNVLRQRE